MSRRSLWSGGWLLIALSSLAHPLYAGEDAESILSKLQKKYSTIKDASVTFRREVKFGVTHSQQEAEGRLLMKKGNRYRLELEEQTIVTDGKLVWSYTKANNQVLIDKYKENSQTLTPDKVLVSIPNDYSAVMLGKEKVQEKETTILKLVPKSTKTSLRWMKVWIDEDDWLMKRVQILDISDNLMTYAIQDAKLNTGLADSQFQFDAPPDAEVIDLR